MDRKTLYVIGSIILIPFFGSAFLAFNFHIGDGTGIPEWALANGKGPEECMKVLSLDIFPRPTNESLQNLCVYKYAELAKDPSACELLMPSEYGMMCFWGAVNEISADVICNPVQGEIICFDEENTKYENPNCSSITNNTMLRDRCYLEYAVKDHDMGLCENIEHPKLRLACAVGVENAKGF